MRRKLASAALLAALALPLAATAQDAGPGSDTTLQMEMKRKRAIVHPAPSRAVIEQDIESSDVLRQMRRDRIIREVTRPEPRRPDLDYAVTSGIQARNLQRLRR